MQQLQDCPCAVRCLDSFEDPASGDYWVVMELCEGGSLMDIMFAVGHGVPEPALARVLHCVLKALAYLHARGLLHRDVKAANVLLTRDGRVRLADFGISKALGADGLRVTEVGSPFWMAPEIVGAGGYGAAVDVYALGVTAIELTDGAPPLYREHPDLSPRQLLQKVATAPLPEFDEPDQVSPELRSFVEQCVRRDPALRPDAAALLRHPFIARTYGKAQQRKALADLISEAQQARRAPEPTATGSGPATLSSLLEHVSDTGTIVVRRAPEPPLDLDAAVRSLVTQLSAMYPAYSRKCEMQRQKRRRILERGGVGLSHATQRARVALLRCLSEYAALI